MATRLEVGRATEAVNRLDIRAFIIMRNVNDAKGGLVKRRALR